MWKKLLPVLFVLLWSGFTAVFAWFVFDGIWRQMRTNAFAVADGVIVKIQQTEHDGGDDTTHGVDVAYTYTVNDKLHQGSRLRYRAGSSSDSWASQFVQSHPVGSKVAVYYDPAQPDDAVLQRGLEGFDLFLALFITPFICVSVGLSAALLFSWRTGMGLAVRDDGEVVRLRPSLWTVPGSMLGALGLATFGSIFVVGFGFGGFHPGLLVTQVAWWVVGLVTLVSGAGTAVWILSGKWDTLLNGRDRTLLLRGQEIAYADIERVEVRRQDKTDSEGAKTVNFSVWLTRHDQAEPVRVKKWLSDAEGARARQMAAYLGLKLGTPAVDEKGAPMVE